MTLREVIDELANALQTAIGLAGQVRRQSARTSGEAELLEASIARAVSALKRLPSHSSLSRRRR